MSWLRAARSSIPARQHPSLGTAHFRRTGLRAEALTLYGESGAQLSNGMTVEAYGLVAGAHASWTFSVTPQPL